MIKNRYIFRSTICNQDTPITEFIDKNSKTLLLVGKLDEKYLPLPLSDWRKIFRFLILGEKMNIETINLTKNWKEVAELVLSFDQKIDFNALKTYHEEVEMPSFEIHELGESLGYVPITIDIEEEEE